MAIRIIYPALESYQRTWRDYLVDKNLRDDWLVRLNELNLFVPTNVCEGHFSCDDQYPLIVLLSAADVIAGLEKLFEDCDGLRSVFDGLVPTDTEYKFSRTTGISNDPDVFFNITRIKLSLCRNVPRESMNFDRATFRWFEAAVSSIEKIDEVLRKHIYQDKQGW